MSRKFGFLTLPLLVLAAGATGGCGSAVDDGSHPADEAEGSTEQALSPLVAPGRGHDMLRDDAADFCTDFRVEDAFPGGSGQTVTFRLELIESSRDLSRKLNVSAAASAKFGLWGGDVKTSYVEEREVHTTSVYALASASVLNSPKVLRDVRLKADAADTLRVSAENFRRRCGDTFVAGYTTGGEFFGIIEIETSSEEDRQKISAELSAGGLMWSASAQFASAVNSKVQNKRVHVWSFQRGGRGTDASGCTTVDCIIGRASNLPTTVAGENSVIVRTDFMSYDRLALPNDMKSPIDTLNQQEVQQDIVNTKHDQRDLLGRFLTAQRSPERYLPVSAGNITAAINTINDNIDDLRSSASACWRNYETCNVPTLRPVPVEPPVPLATEPCERVRQLCRGGHLEADVTELQSACFDQSGRYVNLRTCR